jgi:hypothetical protein
MTPADRLNHRVIMAAAMTAPHRRHQVVTKPRKSSPFLKDRAHSPDSKACRNGQEIETRI